MFMQLSQPQFEELADLFSLLADKTRLTILVRCLDEPISVGEISAQLDLSQPLVSHHLRLLKAARLVSSDRQGKQIFYIASDHHVQHVIKDMAEHMLEEGVH